MKSKEYHKRTKYLLIIAIGLIVIIVNNILGHYYGPFSITWTPLILIFIIAGINYPLYRYNFLLAIVYNYILLLLNDVLIRLFAGGTHDHIGRGWVMLAFISAFMLSTLSMVIYALFINSAITNKKQRIENLLTVLISAILVGLIYWTFNSIL